MKQTETNRIEYKEKLTDDLEKGVVAFLNSKGGNIYIGIDKNSFVVGVNNPDKAQLQIKDRLRDNIRPSILGLFDILTEERDGKTIIVVNLAGGTETPYYVKQKGRSEAGCFIRVGSSAQPMPEEMINSLLEKRHPVSLANIPSRQQDLIFKQLKIFYEGKLNKNFAKSLDFYNPEGKYNQVAYLFSDVNRVSIRVGKYAGKDKLDLIETEEYGDQCLLTAMNKVLDRMDTENITQARKQGMNPRLEKKLVDKDALREVIINAFAHNDYSLGDTPICEIFEDKFIITSYGGLVDGLTLDKFYSGTSMPRNREIMRIFKDLELVEQLGSGVPKIIEKYGRKAISISGRVVQTTLKFDRNMGDINIVSKTRGKTRGKTREKTREKIQKKIHGNPFITTQELADLLGLTAKGIEWNLKKLKTAKIIRRVGSAKSGHWEVIKK